MPRTPHQNEPDPTDAIPDVVDACEPLWPHCVMPDRIVTDSSVFVEIPQGGSAARPGETGLPGGDGILTHAGVEFTLLKCPPNGPCHVVVTGHLMTQLALLRDVAEHRFDENVAEPVDEAFEALLALAADGHDRDECIAMMRGLQGMSHNAASAGMSGDEREMLGKAMETLSLEIRRSWIIDSSRVTLEACERFVEQIHDAGEHRFDPDFDESLASFREDCREHHPQQWLIEASTALMEPREGESSLSAGIRSLMLNQWPPKELLEGLADLEEQHLERDVPGDSFGLHWRKVRDEICPGLPDASNPYKGLNHEGVSVEMD